VVDAAVVDALVVDAGAWADADAARNSAGNASGRRFIRLRLG